MADHLELEHEFYGEKSEDDEEILLFLLLIRRRRRRLRASHRKTWTKRWILRRKQQGAYDNLIREMRKTQKHFANIIDLIGNLLKIFYS